MNIIKSFNNTIDYLETVLDDEIDEKKVTQLSGYSYSMFSRLFSILTETTLSDYLRSRRLTEAAMILRDTDEKIIDVAFKFGYESSDSFATVYKGNIIKNLIMDCQSYTKYRPNETTGGIFVSWRRKEELPTGA